MLKILQKTKPPFKFQYTSRCMENVKGVKWIVCNSFYKVESSTYDSFPDILPIGPLFSSGHHREPTSFWTEDETTLEWLTQQRECSVIHVSFGSFTLFDKHQFQELYLALESLGRPFLWAARPGLVDKSEAAYPKGFLDRVGVLVPTKGGVGPSLYSLFCDPLWLELNIRGVEQWCALDMLALFYRPIFQQELMRMGFSLQMR
ncbi:hypothetical protein AMTRI_Chr10g290 [Amborella trichopoda]